MANRDIDKVRAKIARGGRLSSNEQKIANAWVGEAVRTRGMSRRDGAALLAALVSGPAPDRLAGLAKPAPAERDHAALQSGRALRGGRGARAAASGGVAGSWRGANADLPGRD